MRFENLAPYSTLSPSYIQHGSPYLDIPHSSKNGHILLKQVLKDVFPLVEHWDLEAIHEHQMTSGSYYTLSTNTQRCTPPLPSRNPSHPLPPSLPLYLLCKSRERSAACQALKPCSGVVPSGTAQGNWDKVFLGDLHSTSFAVLHPARPLLSIENLRHTR